MVGLHASANIVHARNMVSKIYAEMGIEYDLPLLSQRVNRKVFSHLLTEYLATQFGEKLTESDDRDQDVSLSVDEENALRYSAGFVPFRLIRKIGNTSDPKLLRFLSCLESMSSGSSDMGEHSCSSFGDYACHWLNLQDRGKLFRVNDRTYGLFLALEKAVRLLLPQRFSLRD